MSKPLAIGSACFLMGFVLACLILWPRHETMRIDNTQAPYVASDKDGNRGFPLADLHAALEEWRSKDQAAEQRISMSISAMKTILQGGSVVVNMKVRCEELDMRRDPDGVAFFGGNFLLCEDDKID